MSTSVACAARFELFLMRQRNPWMPSLAELTRIQKEHQGATNIAVSHCIELAVRQLVRQGHTHALAEILARKAAWIC